MINRNRIYTALACLCLFASPVMAEEASKTKPTEESKKEPPKEEATTTTHTIKINGTDISYKVTVGTQLLLNDTSEPKGSIFYTAYTREGINDLRTRPVTFCFNGGPGSSSIWLHLGVLGPRRVNIDEEGISANHPYHLIDNPYSLLDESDLVFIDPISTGYSRACPGEDPKQFHEVESDIKSVAEFIRLYTTRNERWESPKFLAGESYGTTRAAGLAQELHDAHHLYLDGIILVSSVLNFQTIRFSSGNDLPYILFLPTYTATALYHHKLSDELQADPHKTLQEVERFALGEYSEALMLGDRLPKERYNTILQKLVSYTGLSKEYIDRTNLRINIFRFAKELLRSERRTVGRFDSRLKGIDADHAGETFEYDPSYENIVGLFTSTFNNYVRSELNWKRDEEYKIIADVQPWDYSGVASNQFLDVGTSLRDVINKNTFLDVFVASGYTDLATPYFATEYTFAHLGLDPALRDNIIMKNYEGGHMMYLKQSSLKDLKADLAQFIKYHFEKKQR